MRTERDSFGELSVPDDAYYGAHTQRSLQNFQISSLKWQPELIHAIVLIKKSCAQANQELGMLEYKKAEAIAKACDEILGGKFADQFPLDIFQAGSGTSTNMNVNEVIANRATELLGGKKGERLVHPNDDVNKGESTNNVIPSAIRVASALALEEAMRSLDRLKISLDTKSQEFKHVVKSARTHLQDAVPITLGQEFQAYATAIGKHRTRMKECQKFLKQLGIGGNAVGTGLNTKPAFRASIVGHLNKQIHGNFSVSPDGIESTQFLTDIAVLSSALKNAALDVNKIANDFRLMASGPQTGFNEITLPAVEPGSSIMPGKINPSVCEAVNMACYRVMGNDTTISLAAGAGQLDLNTHMPIVSYCIIESLGILSNASTTFAEKCIDGIKANEERCRWYVEHSAALATALNPHLGYDTVAALVKESLASGKNIRELVIEKGLLNKSQLDAILAPEKLTRQNL
ncbi:MAG: aspartate ammonia-lyase [Nanoarchaeota archaeon]|nr:aspartate ammonia-lyase [Nanoarchaeota archaeon]